MKELADAFWRAAAYCLHPRVMLLSLLPLLIAGGGAVLLGWFYWEDALAAVSGALQGWSLVAALLQWLDSVGASGFRSVLAPLIVVALSLPVIVVVALLLVALLMTPALVGMVARRRFPALERRHGASTWQSIGWSLGCTLVALLALAASLPLWLIPPLVLFIPPLIWGWLGYRVLAFDVLAEHASAGERRELMHTHRWPLLGMGVVTGYLGAAPSLLWTASAALLVLAPILVVVAVWLYTLVFAFSSLWFAHYALAALAALRLQRTAVPSVAPPRHAIAAGTPELPRLAPGAAPRLPPI